MLRKNSGSSKRKESWPLLVIISTKLTSAPLELSAIRIFLLSAVGYYQSVEKEIMQYLIFVSLKALASTPLFSRYKSK